MLSVARSIAIISLCLCSLEHAHAEEHKGNRAVFRFGGLLGGGLVDWAGKDADGMVVGERAVAKPGFSAGLLANLDASRLFSLDTDPFPLALQLELVYATKGTEFERDGVDGNFVDLAYLEAGFLLRVEYFGAGKVAPYVLLGPSLGFLHLAEYNNRFGMTSNIKDNLKSTDLGLILGLGAMYSLPPWGSVGLELRGDLGLVSIDGQGDGDEIRNAALTLLLVYLY
jgi:hypothetical protein